MNKDKAGFPKTANLGKSEIPIIKLMIFIIDWSKVNMITDIFEKEQVRFHFVCKGRGTASSEILDLLGIGHSEKAVVLCLEPDFKVAPLLRKVSKKFGLHSPGTGIAFTIPLSGINHPIAQSFSEELREELRNHREKEIDRMKANAKFDLILAVVNQGYSDELMSVAREAGATGGTIINARSIAHEGVVKFFGISVQSEREIVTILASREAKTEIMQAISRSHGLNSDAKGIVFSLPVDSITGLDTEPDE